MDVDTGALSQQIADLLAGATRYLQKGGEAAAAEAGNRLGSAVWEQALAVWGKCRPKLTARLAGLEAVEDVANTLEEPDAKAALRLQIKKLLIADTDLAAELGDLLANQTYITAQGEAVVANDGGVASRQVAVGRDIRGNVIQIFVEPGRLDPSLFLQALAPRLDTEELTQATERYLQHLLGRYRYLDFRGMGISDRVPLTLPLLEMYVPLKARQQMPEGDTCARELKPAGRSVTEEEAEAMGRRLSEPQPVLQLLARPAGLIILGDPGAGKTTFLKFLTLVMATGQGESLGLGARLPVLLPLSAYAAAEGNPSLQRFISVYYGERGVTLPIDALLDRALEEGAALILLDGLDEVRDFGQRLDVVNKVQEFFCLFRAKGNKFVLTSRVVGYPEVRPSVEGLDECTLVDLDETEVEAFIDKWTLALETAASGDTSFAVSEAEAERQALLDATQRNPGALAANP